MQVLKAGYLPSKKDIAVVILIFIIALGAQISANYYKGHPVSTAVSTSQPVNIQPTVPPASQPEPKESPTPNHANGSPVTITFSPAVGSNPASELKLGIYKNDPSKSQPQPLETINWSANGPIVFGQKINSSAYFRNEGNEKITLYLSTSDWILRDSAGKVLPQNYSQYFTITWDYDNTTINVNETRQITLTLAVSPNLKDVSTFSFELVVTIMY